MLGLSNSSGPRDAQPGRQAPQPIECRPVEKPEIEAAFRLILAREEGLGSDQQVLDFLAFCVERQIDPATTWIAVHGGRIVWALLPVVNPGRTILFFTPTQLFQQTPPAAICELCDRIGEFYVQQNVQLAQLLIDPNDRPVVAAYREAGFDELAELVYLQKSVLGVRVENPPWGPEFELVNYSPKTHAQFAQTIQRSYQNSFDCPALNGVRNIEDVIAGHKSTGEFDPELWWVLLREGQPLAVLLLARLTHSSSMELVYLGLAAEARGKGIGDLLIRFALFQTAAQGRESLTLAVDSRNQPALRLYYRHGLKRIGSRVAMLKNLLLKPQSAAPTEKNSQ